MDPIEFPFVFLGGTCNPTTWRTSVAIPFLTKKNITYFNPQVENWTPEFVALENKMKEVVPVNFFYLDNQTNGTASLVELAFLFGQRKTCIVSIEDNHPVPEINDARKYLVELSKYGNCKIYQNNGLMKALSYVARMHKKNTFSVPYQKKKEKKCFIKKSCPYELKDLCEIAFYNGQCKRLGFNPSDQIEKIPELESSSIDLKDMNRARIYINSLL